MSKPKSYKKTKHIDNQLVVMSRIDFEIAKRVYERALALGMNDEEVSFLLGKRNKYVFDILDPTEKNKFKTEQLDYLPTILKTSIHELIPNYKGLHEEIKIMASKTVYDHKIVYQFTELDIEDPQPVVWTKKLKAGTIRKVQDDLHKRIMKFYESGGFKNPISSLALFLNTQKNLGQDSFSPSDLQKSLSVLMTAKGKLQLLKRVIINARYYYVEKA